MPSNPPVDTPFFTKLGRISDVWRFWLASLTSAANTAAGALLAANNLGDLLNVQTARQNLGLGSASTHAVTDFDTAGAAASAQAASLQITKNLSDVASAASSRQNLGLGSAATHASTDFDASGAAAAAQAAAIAASDPAGSAAAVQAASLQKANNLSDLASAATAKTNLGLAAVASSGSYTDLSNKPTIPAAQVNSDWNASTGVAEILNKPTIPAAQVNSDWNASTGVAQILNKPTLGTAAAQNVGAFDAAGTAAALLTSNNTWSGTNSFTGIPAINGAAGTDRYLAFRTAGANRWILDLTSDAESGSNAGSNIKFSRYTDAGGYNGDVLTLNRATGNATLAGSLNAAGGFLANGVAGLSATVTLAKLTSTGANGSLTVTNGLITAYTAPS